MSLPRLRSALPMTRALLTLLATLSTLHLAVGCDDKNDAPESTREGDPEPASTPSADEGAGPAKAPTAQEDQALPPDSPEARFLAVLGEFAAILEQPDSPAEIAAAFEQYYAQNEARIIETAQAFQQKRAAMTPEELDLFEEKLAQQPEATAFSNAYESFATQPEFKRVEDIMVKIYDEAGVSE